MAGETNRPACGDPIHVAMLLRVIQYRWSVMWAPCIGLMCSAFQFMGALGEGLRGYDRTAHRLGCGD